MESEPSLINNINNSQQPSHRKVKIAQQSKQGDLIAIERTQSEPIPDESAEIVRTPSTFVHVDSSEFQEDRIKKELLCSTDTSRDNFKDEKSSEYDAPVIDISKAKI